MTTPAGVIPLTQPVPQPLRRFGKYLLVQKLAEGGMAEIFLAKQVGAEGFERDVVVKLMLEHFTNSRDFVDMFLDEARLAARLHHPNIVQINDLGVADGRYYLCMEYLAGEDLQTIIERSTARQEPTPIGIAARIILHALEGLEYAHSYAEGGVSTNLVHRDVSPSNIFVTFQGNVKVLDFGIAKASSKFVHTQPGTVKGKLGYMSPEQARGEPLDARSDLFSLGVTFHELLTGRRVFQKDSEVGVLLAMMAQDIHPPSSVRQDVPRALDHIVLRATSRDVSQRYPSASAMREDVEAFLSAHITGSGSSHLASFMVRLFGQDTVQRRTQIPSLRELAARGFVAPEEQAAVAPSEGFEKTFVRPASGPPDPKQQLTDVVAPLPATGPGTVSAPKRRTGLVVTLSVIALAAVGASVALLSGVPLPFQATRVVPPPPPPLDTVGPPPVVSPPPTETVAETATPPETAVTPPVATPPVETATEVPTEVATPKPPRPTVKAIELNATMINGVIAQKRTALDNCAKTHSADVPAGGAVDMVLTIQATGRVTDASPADATLARTQLVRCMSQRLQKVSFPKNTNGPLQYKLKMRFAP